MALEGSDILSTTGVGSSQTAYTGPQCPKHLIFRKTHTLGLGWVVNNDDLDEPSTMIIEIWFSEFRGRAWPDVKVQEPLIFESFHSWVSPFTRCSTTASHNNIKACQCHWISPLHGPTTGGALLYVLKMIKTKNQSKASTMTFLSTLCCNRWFKHGSHINQGTRIILWKTLDNMIPSTHALSVSAILASSTTHGTNLMLRWVRRGTYWKNLASNIPSGITLT